MSEITEPEKVELSESLIQEVIGCAVTDLLQRSKSTSEEEATLMFRFAFESRVLLCNKALKRLQKDKLKQLKNWKIEEEKEDE